MNIRTYLLPLVFAALLLISGGCSNNSTGNNPAVTNFMKAYVTTDISFDFNDQKPAFSIDSSTSTHVTSLMGTMNYLGKIYGITFNFNNLSSDTATYTIGGNLKGNVEFIYSLATSSTIFKCNTGSVMLTQNNTDRISGSFYLTALDTNGAVQAIITNGSFSLPKK